LPATLSHLERQTVPPEIPWEVIVVDNGSTDDTADIAVRLWSNNPPTLLRVVREHRLGLSYARHCGLSEAKYEIVSFIDDDNWVCRDWVQLVSDLMGQFQDVGACGGYNEAVCEITPPYWFEIYKAAYAIGPQGSEPGDISNGRGFLWGAGLSVRKSAWQQLVTEEFRQLLLDRRGAASTAGGDAELSFALRLAGWKLWYDPRLQLRHFLPAHRLEWSYVRSLYRGFGASSVYLDLYSYALEGEPRSSLQQVTRKRESKILALLIKLLWYQAKIRLSFHKGSEGNDDILQREVRTGRLLELLQNSKASELSFLAKSRTKL
jgi:glycosyltransferase involved in cell wall biosynthesis